MMHIKWVFFAGRRENALILVHQLRAMNPLNPRIILSDASANQDLIDRAGGDATEVYVASQVTAKEYNDKAGIAEHPGEKGVQRRRATTKMLVTTSMVQGR